MMNDFYNVIDPKNSVEIEKSFDFFIEEQYNKLIEKYIRDSKIDCQVELKEIPVKQDKNNMVADKNHNSERILSTENLINSNVNSNDDEGLIDITSKDINALHRFFTLYRIESIYDLTKKERDNFLIKNDNSCNINYYKELFAERKKNIMYNLYLAIYEIFKYISNDKMYFNSFDVLTYIICRCCTKKKKKDKSNNVIQEDSYQEMKFKVYDSAIQKIGIDFDLISILKLVDDFDKFKVVYFDTPQREVFNSVAKPTIKVLSENENYEEEAVSEVEEDQKNLNEFKKALLIMIDKGEMSITDKKILKTMGLQMDFISELSKEVLARKEKSKLRNENHKTESVSESKKDSIEEVDTENLGDNHDRDNDMEMINKKFGYS